MTLDDEDVCVAGGITVQDAVACLFDATEEVDGALSVVSCVSEEEKASLSRLNGIKASSATLQGRPRAVGISA